MDRSPIARNDLLRLARETAYGGLLELKELVAVRARVVRFISVCRPKETRLLSHGCPKRTIHESGPRRSRGWFG
jgi:hypothetical protein